MRSSKEIIALSTDFLRYLCGKDYYRQPQPLGKYFCDPRCYYNDFRGKALWKGAFIEGVPASKFSSTGELFFLPVNIFIYGLGSLDRYFFDGDSSALGNVLKVADWMVKHLTSSGYYDNKLKEMNPDKEFYSNNSSMIQGLALSFAVRVVKYDLCDSSVRILLIDTIAKIKNNMLMPVEQGGVVLNNEKGLFLLEYPRKDGNIVLNGWIFSIFGLYDYINFKDDPEVRRVFDLTVKTMEKLLPAYHLSNGWAFYDNMGRVCSPFYQDLHLALLEAMYRITQSGVFGEYMTKAKKANSWNNRIYFTTGKVLEKFFIDKEKYTSVE